MNSNNPGGAGGVNINYPGTYGDGGINVNSKYNGGTNKNPCFNGGKFVREKLKIFFTN